jgi:hypothetical protein
MLVKLAGTWCRWQALLVVMDNRPFNDMAHMLQRFRDDRISLYASWVCWLPHNPNGMDCVLLPKLTSADPRKKQQSMQSW